MGNRKQPFGYGMEFGEVVIEQKEAEIVRCIFSQYLAGQSFQTLANELQRQPVSYEGQRSWNKNMVARILQDVRYAGDKGFPAIIPKEILDTALERRSAQSSPIRTTAAEKVFRQLSGCSATPKMIAQTLDVLNRIAEGQETIVEPPLPSQIEAATLCRELEQLLAQMPVDEDKVNELVRVCAAEQYRAIGSGQYETERLQRIIAKSMQMKELDADLLRTAVSAIEVRQGNVVSVRLKNQQIIGGAD